MHTYVQHVLVGTGRLAFTTPGTADANQTKVIGFMDKTGLWLEDNAAMAAADMVTPALVSVDASNVITILETGTQISSPKAISNLVNSVYAAPTMATATIDFTSATIVAGNRYVIRSVYHDVITTGNQFTHTEEVIAESTSAADLVDAFVARINSRSNARVVASEASATSILLTAKDVNDNEGVNSINEYSMVQMDVTATTNNPADYLSNYSVEIPGVVITQVESNPGVGYWKLVRDIERRNLGYKGVVMTGAYPRTEGTMNVVEGTTYDNVTAEYNNEFRSNDNQYIKSTPLAANIYVTAGAGAGIKAALESFQTQTEI